MFAFSIDLPVRTEWKNVDLMRTSVQSCFSAVFSEIDGCNALSMVTGELLENAMKYGEWAEPEEAAVFRLRICGDEEKATIEVQNPVSNDSPHFRRLLDTIAKIDSYESAEEAYKARMLEIAQAADSHVSQLGLVRVAYEGNGKITTSLDDETLTVSVAVVL